LPIELPSLDDVAKQFEKKDPLTPSKNAPNQTPEDVKVVESTETKPIGQVKDAEDAIVQRLETEAKDPVEEVVEKSGLEAKAPLPPEKPVDKTAARFAAIARREKEVRAAELAYKQAQVAREQEIARKEQALAEREERLKSAKDPLSVLKAHGFSYDDATQHAIGAWKTPEVDPLDVKLNERLNPVQERLSEVDQLRQRIAQLEEDRVNRADAEWTNTINDTLKSGECEFTLSMGQEGIDTVKEVQRQHYQKFKNYLSYSDACARVEQYYSEWADKLANTQKYKTKVAPPQNGATKQVPKIEAKSAPTLTQAHSSASRAKPDLDKMSSRDAIAYLASNVLKYRD